MILGLEGTFNTTISSLPVSNSIGAAPLLLIIILIIAIGGLAILITSLERYTNFLNAITQIVKTVKYAIYGAGISISIYGLYIICGVITTAASGFDPIIIVYLIGGYIALTIIGWVAEKAVIRAKAMHTEYLKAKSESI